MNHKLFSLFRGLIPVFTGQFLVHRGRDARDFLEHRGERGARPEPHALPYAVHGVLPETLPVRQTLTREIDPVLIHCTSYSFL